MSYYDRATGSGGGTTQLRTFAQNARGLEGLAGTLRLDYNALKNTPSAPMPPTPETPTTYSVTFETIDATSGASLSSTTKDFTSRSYDILIPAISGSQALVRHRIAISPVVRITIHDTVLGNVDVTARFTESPTGTYTTTGQYRAAASTHYRITTHA